MDGDGDGRRPAAPVQLSDDDEDGLPPAASTSGSHGELSTRSQLAVRQRLERQGVRMRPAWLASCLSGLAGVRPGFATLPTEAQAELCFAQVLMADLNVAAAGCLPPDCHALHKSELAGPYLLQVDEVVDVGSSLRERYKEKQGGRCLKLSMTDGVQRVFGVEYRLVPAFQVLFPAGSKIVVRNVLVRRGLFLLVPEIVEVLGGGVQRLEEARQRVVQEVNKPPRGKRANAGRAQVNPSLAEQASAAAWPVVEESGVTEEVGRTSRNQTQSVLRSDGRAHISGRSVCGPSLEQIGRDVNSVSRNENVQPPAPAGTAASAMLSSDRIVHTSSGAALAGALDPATISGPVSSSTLPMGTFLREVEIDAPLRPRSGNRLSLRKNITRSCEVDPSNGTTRDMVEASTAVDVDEVRGCLPNDPPFTYLVTLRDTMVAQKKGTAGRVKCVLVGVKEFFLIQSGCKLIVHIEDGSLITEAAVKDEVVMDFLQQLPQGPSQPASGTSNNLRSLMTSLENRRHLQSFLQQFEGFMDVEFQVSGDIPVITKMIQEFRTADGWLLLDRVNQPITLKNTSHKNDVIELLSP